MGQRTAWRQLVSNVSSLAITGTGRFALAAGVITLTLAAGTATSNTQTEQAGTGTAQSVLLSRLNSRIEEDPEGTLAEARLALSELGDAPGPTLEMALLEIMARAAELTQDLEVAFASVERWRELATEAGIAEQQVASLVQHGWIFIADEQLEEAMGCFSEAMARDGLQQWPELRAAALHGIGRIHGSRGDPVRGLQEITESFQIFSRLERHRDAATTATALGILHGMEGNLDEARRHFEEALRLFETLQDNRRRILVLNNLAVVTEQSGEVEDALRQFRQVYELARELARPREQGLALNNIGEALLGLNRPGEALDHLQRSLRIAQSEGQRQLESWCEQNLARAHQALGNSDEALRHFVRYMELHEEIHNAESEERFARMQARYESEKRERETEELRRQAEAQTAELSRQSAVKSGLAAGAGLLLLALGLVANRQRKLRNAFRLLSLSNEEIRRQKAELEVLRASLEVRVQDRTKELVRVNSELQQEINQRKRAENETRELQARYLQSQKLQAVGLLAGGVAHDFNNILTGISMTAELAVMESSSGGPEADHFQEILRLTRRAAELTRQLLAFGRRQLLQPTRTSLHEVVQRTAGLIQRLIGEHIEVRFTPSAAQDTVDVDEGQIEQVLVNLAINARDAMPRGGLLDISTRLTEAADPFEVRGEMLPAGRYILLSVRDQGEGMSDQVMERLFEPFFTTKAPGRGTGLGLATAYGILRQHRGAIEVQSTLGAGSCFDLLLPLSEASHEPDVAAVPELTAAIDLDGGNVLVLEDDDGIRGLTLRLLEQNGLKPIPARDCRDAAKVLAERGSEICLLISDVVLPGGSGPEFYREQVIPEFPHVKVLFISGHSDEMIQRHRFGETLPFLQKPFSNRQLLQSIARIIGQDRH